MADEPELKSCPFCGRQPRIGRNKLGGIYIYCPDEEGVDCSIEAQSEAENAEAIAAWNTRAQ